MVSAGRENRSYKYKRFFAKPEEQALLLFWLNENIGNVLSKVIVKNTDELA